MPQYQSGAGRDAHPSFYVVPTFILISNGIAAGVGLLRALNPDLVMPMCSHAEVDILRRCTIVFTQLW